PAKLASVLTQRARVTAGDPASAERAIAGARDAAVRVHDAALRQTLDVQLEIAEAIVRRATDPRGSIAAFDRAIAFLSASRLRQYLPDAYFQRGRAHRAAGDDPAAIADYASALRETAAQQRTIEDGGLRLRFLDTAS